MQGETRKRWMQLCELASTERDPQKLLELVAEINLLIEEEKTHMGKRRPDREVER